MLFWKRSCTFRLIFPSPLCLHGLLLIHLTPPQPTPHPQVPKPVNQQIVNEGPSSKQRQWKRQEEQAQSDEKGRSLDQLSVCQNMSTRLSPCLLSSLMWVPHWALHEDHNTAVAPQASLSCSIKFERERNRQTVRREINYMFQ